MLKRFCFLGRCKSAFHEFLVDILELVADRFEVNGVKFRQMVLPHYTWDKFGELLAESGGRSLGLFNELMSFFSTMICIPRTNYRFPTLESTRNFFSYLLERPKHAKLVNITKMIVA